MELTRVTNKALQKALRRVLRTNESSFGELLNMGNEIDIQKAVKRLTKRARKISSEGDTPQLESEDEYEQDEDGSSNCVDVEERQVPLAKVVEWFRNWNRGNNHVGSHSEQTTHGNDTSLRPYEFHTGFSKRDVEQVTRTIE